jgi:hypothetical protein
LPVNIKAIEADIRKFVIFEIDHSLLRDLPPSTKDAILNVVVDQSGGI